MLWMVLLAAVIFTVISSARNGMCWVHAAYREHVRRIKRNAKAELLLGAFQSSTGHAGAHYSVRQEVDRRQIILVLERKSARPCGAAFEPVVRLTVESDGDGPFIIWSRRHRLLATTYALPEALQMVENATASNLAERPRMFTSAA